MGEKVPGGNLKAEVCTRHLIHCWVIKYGSLDWGSDRKRTQILFAQSDTKNTQQIAKRALLEPKKCIDMISKQNYSSKLLIHSKTLRIILMSIRADVRSLATRGATPSNSAALTPSDLFCPRWRLSSAGNRSRGPGC